MGRVAEEESDTYTGTLRRKNGIGPATDVATPTSRRFLPRCEWLLERRKRAESPLISVVATCYL